MKLTLENIGLVKHAELDLSKDLIVLCGPNNTGKTYAAYCVYGLCSIRDSSAIVGPGPFVMLREGVQNLDDLSEINLKEIFFESRQWILDYLHWTFKVEIPFIFGSPEANFKDSQSLVLLDFEAIWDRIVKVEYHEKIRYQGLLTIEKTADSDSISVIHSQSSDIRNGKLPVFENLVNNAIRRLFMRAIFPNAHIEPTERIAVNLFWKEIVIQRSFSEEDPVELNEEKLNSIRPFSLPIRKSLEQASRLGEIRLNSSPFEPLASEVENNILGGSLSINADSDVMFSPVSSSKSIGIHEAGSSVKALANIVFYLRHQAQPGDLYIIDEPELTLHPDNQRKMARILAKMVNAGIKVIMSTHSDYIIRELNNLMMLKMEGHENAVTKLMHKYGYHQDELLDHKRVGAYLFTHDVKSLEVNETGFEVKTIDDEINDLNNSSSDIFFTLHD